MITLPSHTLQALQPLYVSCFKPFKTTFKKVKNASMFRSNDMEPYKTTLTRWVDKTLKQLLTKKIKSGFRNIGILWAFNLKAMDGKT
jgi:hypothetical protein